ncbi:uncharacterized protein H6S33_012398 [Morchella sextelata]|uniref:uncharacterized protein n=1 Tax=Morchella sextelata TaxID=1174677 RepID=UPI001D0413F1|nr:uncharacterized protein H6S33_012398 [Morchella sextelata]KAH0609852.1 hypothetical protein H6S33_012398 [Morchella sextelata]
MSDSSSTLWGGLLAAAALLLARGASAHEHASDAVPEGSVISPDPVDSILWLHIFAMLASFGVIFPTGMVLGIVRSRLHVPVQVLGTSIAVVGYFLGHMHKGRQFAPNIHAKFANSLMLMLCMQVAGGVYLKCHLEKGWHGRVRGVVVRVHGVIGKLMPLVSWTQMLFGGITAMGFCHADHTGQCLAHFIMGSSFIAYGMIMTLMLFVGQAWLARTGRSQEFWDSLVITIWGVINTFTEHRWGNNWAHNDIQHTSMGIVWACAGLLGLWLSRGNKRNLVPGIVIFLTGWAMSAHPQHLMLSTMVHQVFGYTLMAAGLSRIIEIAFVVKDKPALGSRKDTGEINSWQHLPPYLLFASGFIFMSANEEQLALVDAVGIDHVSYLLVLYSLAFLLYLFTMVLINLFVVNKPEEKKYIPVSLETPNTANGYAGEREHRRIADAEEFELDGLISDEEAEEEIVKRQ